MTEVCIIRQLELQIESPECVKVSSAFRDLVTAWVSHGPCQTACRVTQSLNVAELSAADSSDVTLYGYLFVWPVHLPVVEHEPTERILIRFLEPVSIVLPVVI